MPEGFDGAFENPREDAVRAILSDARVIAVVGLSGNPERDSHQVAAYLQEHGYRIIPVNPNVDVVLGEQARPSLEDIPGRVDVVDIFRRVSAVLEIVDAAIHIRAKVIWMQDGIIHHEAAAKARAAGLQVVMDKCMMREHRAGFATGQRPD